MNREITARGGGVSGVIQHYAVERNHCGHPLNLQFLQGAAGTVGDHYERIPCTIHVDDTLRNAVSLMFSNDQTWLACVDRDGFYRGYLTQRGITHLLGATYRDA